MTRADVLSTVQEGQLIHGRGDRGASMLLHVLAVTDTTICAWRLLTGGHEAFDYQTGRGDRCQLDSIAPLPPDIHETIFNLDRRQRSCTNVEDAKLTTAEREAFVFIHHFYLANQLPER